MKRQGTADLALTAAILLLGGSLLFSGTSLIQRHQARLPQGAANDLSEILGVAAAGCGLALLLWWLLALIAAAVVTISGRRNHVSRFVSVAEGISPLFMRRLLATTLSLNLLGAPLAQAQTGVDPSWHPGVGMSQSTPAPVSNAAPDPLPAQELVPIEPRWVPQTAPTDAGALVRPAHRDEPPAQNITNGAPETLHVVQRGDSLWSIVAHALGPYATDVDVAEEWPRWYQANRDVIGANPHLIFPGQVLHAP